MNRWSTRLAGIAAAAMTATIAPSTAALAESATPGERAATIARPAVVYVETHWRGWIRDTKTGEVFGGRSGYQVTTRCSGFFAGPDGTVVTATHCVDSGAEGAAPLFYQQLIADLSAAGRITDADEARETLATRTVLEGAKKEAPVVRDIYVQTGEVSPGASGGDTMVAKEVSLSPRSAGGIAILKVNGGRQPALEVAGTPSAGTPIVLIGYPGGSAGLATPSVSEGNLGGEIDLGRLAGGVVVDRSGRVVGLVGATGDADLAAEGGPSLAILPTSAITEQLAVANVTAGLGPADRNYRRGVDYFYAGQYSLAIRYFNATLAAIPSHALAEELSAEAVDLRAQHGDAIDWVTVGMFIAAGLILLGLLGWLVVVLLRRRRHRRASVAQAPAAETPAVETPVV